MLLDEGQSMNFDSIDPAARHLATSSHMPLEGRALLGAVRPGEGKSVVLFFAYAFLLMLCYYLLKTLREPLLLTDGSAELKSYASGAIALVLLVLVPAYSALFRRTESVALVRGITLFFAVNVALFYVMGRAGLDIGFTYYVWCGVFNVTMIAQLWAHAAHSFDVPSGERLLPVIMLGATAGAVAAPPLTGALFPLLGPFNLMLVAMLLLLATLPLIGETRAAVPGPSQNRRAAHGRGAGDLARLARDRYLWLLAGLVVVLNCVNSIGEFILSDHVIRMAEARVAADSSIVEASVIAGFYGNFYFAANTLAVIVQVLLVGRLFRCIGVHGTLLALPIVALLGYALVAFIPVFTVIRVVKILENGVNYSLMNTARHVLFLPLPTGHQYQGKTAIDTLFWRAGDLLQAGAIYAGLHWFGLEAGGFALLNVVLAGIWMTIVGAIAREYARRSANARDGERRSWFKRAAVAAGGLAAIAASAGTAAAPRGLFEEHVPVEIELVTDMRNFCRNPTTGCADSPGQIVYRGDDGRVHRVEVSLRARGRWRRDTAACRWPALFVRFSANSTQGTPFDGESMLPLTTHCRDASAYEQYLLKEYLAYRIYNELTDLSLSVRLARITYRDAAQPGSAKVRLGFFTEHFESLAARHGAAVVEPDHIDLERLDWDQFGTFALFQYLIGNTDWSAIYGHNTLHLARAGQVVPVPYDFDFSGLVDAAYAGPPPLLPITDVTERLFRGYCRPAGEWEALYARFAGRRSAVERLLEELPGLEPAHAARVHRYLNGFYAIVASPEERAKKISGACRDASLITLRAEQGRAR
jgi:AAA family ATP:ADP antiporter